MKREKMIKKLVKEFDSVNDIYNKINKELPYKIPSKFVSWDKLSSLISLQLNTLNNRKLESALTEVGDAATFHVVHKYSLWFIQKAPIYCISSEVLDAIMNTKINDSLVDNLSISLPTMMLLFPKTKLNSPDGIVDHLIVHTSDSNKPELSMGEWNGFRAKLLKNEYSTVVTCSTMDTSSYSWYTAFGIEDGKIKFNNSSNLGTSVFHSNDKEFVAILRKIAFMVYVMLQSNPEMISEISDSNFKSVGKGFGVNNATKNIYPRMINVSKRNKSTPELNKQGKSGSSKRTHWRRSHYRLINSNGCPKLVYVKASIINPE